MHLGGWTPFRFDITDRLRSGTGSEPHELVVRVDEKVGHNSQGFLPIVAPHFGGMWQDVQLLIVPGRWMDERHLLAVGDPATGAIHLEIPLRGQAARITPRARCALSIAGHTGMVTNLQFYVERQDSPDIGRGPVTGQ